MNGGGPPGGGGGVAGGCWRGRERGVKELYHSQVAIQRLQCAYATQPQLYAVGDARSICHSAVTGALVECW